MIKLILLILLVLFMASLFPIIMLGLLLWAAYRVARAVCS